MRRLAVPAALVVVLALAGCTSEPETVATSTPDASAPAETAAPAADDYDELVEAATYPETYEDAVAANEALWWWVDENCAPDLAENAVTSLNSDYGHDQDLTEGKAGAFDGADLLKLRYADAVENACG